MRIYTLCDICINGKVDGVIVAYETTREELQAIVDSVKTECAGFWTIDDILENLPKDCTYHECDSNSSVWY
jgi:hypothetical protein